DLHRLPGRDVDALDAPAERRGNLDRRLVGLDLQQRRVLAYDVALAHEHLANFRFGQALAEIGERERARHGGSLVRSDCADTSVRSDGVGAAVVTICARPAVIGTPPVTADGYPVDFPAPRGGIGFAPNDAC